MRLARPADRVVLVHIITPGEATDPQEQETVAAPAEYTTAAIKARYEALVAGLPQASFLLVPRAVGIEAPGSVSSQFLDVASEEGADIVVIGVDGLAATAAGAALRVGSNTDAIARKARCSVLTCQVRDSTKV
jgi:nucleotide-binding universal stress UspA family protein